MTLQDQANLAARKARQRKERHQAYLNGGIWLTAVCVLIWVVKYIVERGAI